MIVTASKTISSSAQILPGTILNSDIADDEITNAKINSAAAIAYAKLNLTGAVLNADLAGSIADSKLSQITTASKVSGAALTSLANIPAGAGVIPSANIPTAASLVLAGSNTTEFTSSSAVFGDRLGVSSLSIAANVPILIHVLVRKTSGGNEGADFGLKLNTTTVLGVSSWSGGTNQNEAGSIWIFVPARIANYLRAGWAWATKNGSGTVVQSFFGFTADCPTATITDVMILGATGGTVTGGWDELRVWTFPVS